MMQFARLLRISLIVAILAGLSISPAPGQAQPPAPVDRFRWVRGLDDLYPCEHGTQLSRPLPTHQRADIPLPDPSFAIDFAHYPTSAEILAFLNELEAAYPGLVGVLAVGESWQGRPIVAVRTGNQAAGDADGRPALYVDGQHHAREAVSAQVVLYFAWYLASRYGSDPLVTHLLDTRTVSRSPP